MSRWWPTVLAVSCAVVAACGSFLADRAARRARPAQGDSGIYWGVVACRTCWLLGVPALLSMAAVLSLAWWQSGLHFQFDRVLGAAWAFPAALVVPFAAWAVTLVVPAGSGERIVARGLAGAIGEPESRRWVLHTTWIPLVALLLGAQRLGVGADAYPAFTWGTLVVLVISLAQIARSLPAPSEIRAAALVETPTAAPSPPPWPEAMRAHGITFDTITTWESEAARRAPRGDEALAFEASLTEMGAVEVAPEVIEAVGHLVAAATDAGPALLTTLVRGPHDCGQVEAVALAAATIRERQKQATLIIAPRRQPLHGSGAASSLFTDVLGRWLAACHGGEVQILHPGGDTPAADKDVWVVDAQTLSDSFVERLTEEAVARRVGLVVWWDVHAYTGVLAANVWAISRRLDRLLNVRGTPGIRTLLLARDAPHGVAQLETFIRRLFPYEFGQRPRVERRAVRQVQLHRLTGHEARFAGSDLVPERLRQLSLIAALVSTEQRWPTYVERPPEVTESEQTGVFELQVGGEVVRDHITGMAAEAGASVRWIADGDVLSIAEIVGQGGRTAPAGLPHHAAITLSENPFAAYLADGLGRRPAATSRRLIGAESHSTHVERHMLAALREMEDTRSGLVATFLSKEDVVQRKLDELDSAGLLIRDEVRFLDEAGVRRIDYLYRSRMNKAPVGPLDTVRLNLTEIREPTTAQRAGGVRMAVDPERTIIQAYPGRVFMERGWRYRVRDWTDASFKRQGWIECEVDESFSMTWRIRNPQVGRLRRQPGTEGVVMRSAGGVLLRRMALDLEYQEEVLGVLRLERDLTTGHAVLRPSRLPRPRLGTPFATRALALLLVPPPNPPVLFSLCLVLRCVLPVLVGVEDDALEIVPLVGRHIADRESHGVAIVDLYPDGIGLIDAFQDDERLIGRVIEAARDWLADIVSGDGAGVSTLLKSPHALAVPTEHDVAGAEALLTKVMSAVGPVATRPASR